MLRYSRLIGLGVIVMAAGLGANALAQGSPWSQLGDAYRARSADADVVARVNGEPVTRAELRIGIALAQFNNSVSPQKVATDGRAALGQVIQARALATEARARGIVLSPAEVAAYIAEVRQGFASAGHAQEHLDEFLAGVGQTPDQFFAGSFARSHYGEAAATARLRASVVSATAPQLQNATWDAFVASVTQRAKVEIVDPTLR